MHRALVSVFQTMLRQSYFTLHCSGNAHCTAPALGLGLAPAKLLSFVLLSSSKVG